MMGFVIDASITVRLFVPEELSELAARLEATDIALHAPAHMPSEFANALIQKVRRAGLPREEAALAVEAFRRLPVTLHDTLPILGDALDLAVRFDRTVYDTLYVALAQRLGARMVTADRRLYNALKDALPETMLWVEELPETPDDTD